MPLLPDKQSTFYVPIIVKFILCHLFATCWMLLSISLSQTWIKELETLLSLPVALFIVAGIAYIPGYMNAFMLIGLLLDKQPPLGHLDPTDPITILIPCFNEEDRIYATIRYVAKQHYSGLVKVIVIDNQSTDQTVEQINKARKRLGIPITILTERKPGKHHALNAALPYITSKFFITLDADTLLHPDSIRHLVGRINASPENVCAVAGAILAHNSRERLMTKMQEWDYFLGIASIKRLQGMFQGTLVAQGAFSLYKTDEVRKLGGWPDAIGEDIVLTWQLLSLNNRVYFEPLAVAFTDVPTTFQHFFRQRSRWARGMIEALQMVKPWRQPSVYAKYFTGANFFIPYLDVVFTFFWIPGLFLAFAGYYWIVGFATLLVLPLTLLINYILFRYQKRVFHTLSLQVRHNALGFILYLLFYQMMMSPISVWGYIQELTKRRRVWK